MTVCCSLPMAFGISRSTSDCKVSEVFTPFRVPAKWLGPNLQCKWLMFSRLNFGTKCWHSCCYQFTVEEPRKESIGNMKLIKYLMAGVTAIIVASGLALSAHATQIEGDIDFVAEVSFDSTSLGSATMV